jgi:hypothetical protein
MRSRNTKILCSLSFFVATGLGCGPDASKTEKPTPARSTGGSGGSAGGAGGSAAGTGGAGGSTAGTGGAGAGTGGTTGGTSAGGTGGGPSAGSAIPLPMVVTMHYENQGWFGDPGVQGAFGTGSVIQQGSTATGPCAQRPPGARGQCLKVVYTPPSGVTAPPTGGWVGVFFLTTILQNHDDKVPPLKIGDANWGAEPGRNVAPGATKISFSAAAATAGLAVTFKAGTDQDSFVIPEQVETLGTAWASYALPFNGASYGSNVIGAFCWVLKDTTKPATFYLDNIVWE